MLTPFGYYDTIIMLQNYKKNNEKQLFIMANLKIRAGIVQTGINSQYDKRRSVLQAKLTESIKQSV